MERKQLLNLVDSFKLPVGQYYILGGGSLVLNGIRDIAGDLDMCVSEEAFKQLKHDYNIDESKMNSCGFYPVTDEVEVVVNAKEDMEYDMVDGYPVEKLTTILKFKEQMNREKDQEDIRQIKRKILRLND